MFAAALKKAEAEAQVKWLSEIAHIGKGGNLETVTTEEFDAAGNLKTRTTRTHHQPGGVASVRVATRTAAPG